VDLRAKFRAGQTIKYVFDQTSKNQVKSLDAGDTSMDQDQEQTQRIGLSLKVVDSGDAGATIQVVYESIKVTLKTPDGLAEYDSAKAKSTPSPSAQKPGTPASPGRPAKSPAMSPTKPGAPAKPGTPAPAAADPTDPLKQFADLDMNGMLGGIVGPMVGTTITVKTDKAGAITSVSGGETLGGNLGGLGSLAGAGLVPNPSQLANWLVSGLGGPGNQGYARVGETWTDNDALSGTPVGAFRMTTKHTLKSAAGGSANVTFVGHIEPASEASQPGGAGSSAGQVQKAAYNGSYVWDTRGGSLAEMNTAMSVTLDGGVMGAKARMSSDTKVHVKRQ
jgi:hypothetical protein